MAAGNKNTNVISKEFEERVRYNLRNSSDAQRDMAIDKLKQVKIKTFDINWFSNSRNAVSREAFTELTGIHLPQSVEQSKYVLSKFKGVSPILGKIKKADLIKSFERLSKSDPAIIYYNSGRLEGYIENVVKVKKVDISTPIKTKFIYAIYTNKNTFIEISFDRIITVWFNKDQYSIREQSLRAKIKMKERYSVFIKRKLGSEISILNFSDEKSAMADYNKRVKLETTKECCISKFYVIGNIVRDYTNIHCFKPSPAA